MIVLGAAVLIASAWIFPGAWNGLTLLGLALFLGGFLRRA